ncbi:glycoside hydrolase family 140 protein [Oscillochloris sp. ZM17-4]|uniref:glycoside hydrolase family 140 protein n=1 Tax=Oscillochloris sp. ZM17-4 TaxID=2866714 RepID=UPI001C738139|nr:glycoside hydrolase family 140 protein [Oscillochloris sp. ZM17-4]MBX0329613.1 glycoside hydrolase family 140 protein [Oscillochloris sp. ZM17-4]
MPHTAPPRLAVSVDGHHLVTTDGRPFFWLGDTAWELFHRLTLDEATAYLENRAAKGFTVIQAVALAEFDGLHTPTPAGARPLHSDDPAKPDEAYFAHMDAVIRLAAALGLYIGLLPTWGDKVTPMWGGGPAVFTESNARAYGRWLGARYKGDSNLIWVLGGDRPPQHDGADDRTIWRAMASGLADGLGRVPIISYHPPGGTSSATWLHSEPWVSLNMIQSGHGAGHDVPTWEMIAHDYARLPPKPTLDGEPNYEDHPVSPWPTWDPASGYFDDYDVRKQCWRSVFAGGCGVTYGHHAIWQCAAPSYAPVNHVTMTWREALDRPGAGQVRHLRALIESRPMLTRIPDQSIIAGGAGSGGAHSRACRGSDGAYLMIYLPTPQPISVRLDAVAGKMARAWWYDPRDGAATPISELPTEGTQTFTPPAGGPDWALVIDDVALGFPPPGRR